VWASFGGLAASQNRVAEEEFAVGAGEVVVFRLTMAMGALKNTIRAERIEGPEFLVPKLRKMTMVAAEVQSAP
jgi:hypothetical protein